MTSRGVVMTSRGPISKLVFEADIKGCITVLIH